MPDPKTIPVDKKPAPAPHRVRVEVKSDNGKFLFLYHVDKHAIEVHRRGMTYMIPLADLMDFGRTSERAIFRVHPVYVEPSDDSDIVRQEFE